MKGIETQRSRNWLFGKQATRLVSGVRRCKVSAHLVYVHFHDFCSVIGDVKVAAPVRVLQRVDWPAA